MMKIIEALRATAERTKMYIDYIFQQSKDYTDEAVAQGMSGDYLSLAGGTMMGNVNMANHKVTNLPDPSNEGDAVSKGYADEHYSASGGTEDYRELTNKPQINSNTLSGNQGGDALGLVNNPATANQNMGGRNITNIGGMNFSNNVAVKVETNQRLKVINNLNESSEEYTPFSVGDPTLDNDAVNLKTLNQSIKTFYGTCSTLGSTAVKAVTCTGFPTVPTAGIMLIVRFDNGNTAQSPSLSINGGTYHSITYKEGYSNFRDAWNDMQAVEFVFDGTGWTIISVNNDHQNSQVHFGTCSTSSVTNIKQVSAPGFPTLFPDGAILNVYFSAGSGTTSVSLVINGDEDPVPVRASGTLTTMMYQAWSAGQIVTFIYHSGYFYMIAGHEELYDMEIYGTNPQEDWHFGNVAYEIVSGSYSDITSKIEEGYPVRIMLREQIWYGDHTFYTRKQIVTPLYTNSSDGRDGLWITVDKVENPYYTSTSDIRRKLNIKSDGTISVYDVQ